MAYSLVCTPALSAGIHVLSICAATAVTLYPAYIATRTPVERLGARLGTFVCPLVHCEVVNIKCIRPGAMYIGISIAMLAGTPTAGALVPKFTQANFNKAIAFTGSLLIGGGLVLSMAHLKTLRDSRKGAASVSTMIDD